jgi:hypothetical protein
MLPQEEKGRLFAQNVEPKKILATAFAEVFLLKLFYFGCR